MTNIKKLSINPWTCKEVNDEQEFIDELDFGM